MVNFRLSLQHVLLFDIHRNFFADLSPVCLSNTDNQHALTISFFKDQLSVFYPNSLEICSLFNRFLQQFSVRVVTTLSGSLFHFVTTRLSRDCYKKLLPRLTSHFFSSIHLFSDALLPLHSSVFVFFSLCSIYFIGR